MANTIWETYPPKATEEQLDYLAQTVKDWTVFNGLAVRPNPSFVSDENNPNKVLATNAPVTLYPSPFPRKCFEQAQSLQKVYNELYAAIASDEGWLGEIMKELIEVDSFLANLWKIHLQVKEEGYAQHLTLGMFRSDYMLHLPTDTSPPSLKQVEFNTISSSFGGLAVRVAQMHTELANYPFANSSLAYPPHPLFNTHAPIPPTNSSSSSTSTTTTPPHPRIKTIGIPPPNTAITTLTTALAISHTSYGPSKSQPPLPLCILILVQPHERNTFDQLSLTAHLRTTHPHIPTFRLPTPQILTYTSIPAHTSNPSRPLIYTPPSSPTTPFEVSTIYFRALYSPTEYDTPTSWAARHHLERSAAIKCPSVLLHLAGSKKIQQVLTETSPSQPHGILPRFLPNTPPSTLAALQASFAPQYSMSSPDAEGLTLALNPSTAQNHVLKPQREGGGNNIYRSAIPKFLATVPEREYKQYILMELISPPSRARNTALRSDGEVVTGDVISELGIFGGCLFGQQGQGEDKGGDGKGVNMLWNEEGGVPVKDEGEG